MTEPAPGPRPDHPTPAARPADPERGLRGAMSALLVLEAIVILLGIPVAANTGNGAGPVGVGLICALAAAHLACCAVISRPFAVPVIIALQVLLIACWLISGPLGVMGIVFALVWGAVLYMRREYRRRAGAGLLPRPDDPGPADR
ncbi:MAG TPA: DUF4233 domain-containing protein [Nakamurella sp.]|nr:DUF4233 domain-containing protein [Nakamurella sp.]